jgi:hypothetical protein
MARKAKNPKPPAKPKTYRSGFERKTKTCLDEAKVQYEYETERIPYTVPETRKNYIPDFKVTTRSGKTIYVECKGRWLANDFQKLKLVKQQYPDLDLRMVFQRDLPIRKGSNTRYSTRAMKLNIPFTVSSKGTVPQQWLEE